jgi:DNA-binding CsgD family transcriptional regulator/N-acetylneuraminic acid mutarotase
MDQDRIEPLSSRELELIEALSRGLSNREIARELCISPNTVKAHLRKIYTKLNVSSRTEATLVALRMGWVGLDASSAEESAGQGAAQEGEERESITAATAPERREIPAPPLALWKRVYLVVCALLVAAGSWLTWPVRVEQTGPFSDRPAQVEPAAPWSETRWEGLTQMPTPRTRLAVAAWRGRVYAIGGESPAGVTGVVEVYVPDADEWERGADKLTPAANVGAVVLDGRIYVPGGSERDGRVSDRLEIYDPAADAQAAWTTGASLPMGISAYAIAGYEGQLYLFGGWDGRSYAAAAYRYDPEIDRWASLAPMGVPRAFAGAGVLGERIYVVGGYNGRAELDTCEVYDPAADAWQACPAMKASRGGVGVAAIGDTLYVIGGGWKEYLVENEYFVPGRPDPAAGEWKTFASPLLQEWRNMGVTSDGMFLYAIGGWDGEFLSINQVYRAVYRFYLPSTIGQGLGGSQD